MMCSRLDLHILSIIKKKIYDTHTQTAVNFDNDELFIRTLLVFNCQQ